MAKLLLIFLFVPLNAFIINNKYINEDGLKVFTVSNEIKHNNCSCACNCLNEQLPLDKPLQAPAPPISNAPKQFVIKKVIHNNDCNCACSCVPNELDEQIQTTTPRQFNDVQNGILEELRTTIEESIALTTKPINNPTPKQQIQERLIETTTHQYWTTTEYNTELPETTTQQYWTSELPKDAITTGYRTAPPQTEFEYKTKLETTTGYATGPPHQTTDQRSGFWPDPSAIPLPNGQSLQSLFNSFSTTPAPFTLPPIKWPFPPITNPFSQPSPSTIQPTNSQTNLWSQPWQTNTWTQPSPWTQQSIWPNSLEQKTRNTGTTGQNAWAQTWWPSSAGSSGSTNQPTSNNWKSTSNQPASNNWQSTTNRGQGIGSTNQPTSNNWQSTTNQPTSTQNVQTTSNPWSSRFNQQTTNQNSQTSSPNQRTSLPEITVDNDISTQTTNQNSQTSSLNQFTSKTFSESQTTNGQSSTSFWTRTPAKEKDFVPGLEISPGGIDSSFTKSVAITSTKLNSSPSSNPPQEVLGDTQRSTTVAIKSPHFTAELNDQPASTVQQADQKSTTLSPDFKEKVQTLLERLKQQLQKMKIQEAAKQSETTQSGAGQSETTLQPEDHDERLNEMRVDLQQILANNSINEETAVTDKVQNEDGTTKTSDRKELMQKLNAIRGMLDKMKTRTTTAEPTTQTPIQTTLAPIIEQTITDLLTIAVDTTTLTPNSVTQININSVEPSNQQSTTSSEEPSTITPNSVTQVNINSVESSTQQSTTYSEEPSTITPNIVTQSQTNEAETSTVMFTEVPIITTTDNQEFLHRLHEKLMNLKTKLDEMRQQMSQTTNTPLDATTQTVVEKEEDRPDFNQLNAQLANIKNSLASSEDIQRLESDVKNEQSMRKKMQETLDTLKQELNKLQNEQRTTLSIGLSSVQTTTPINKVVETSTSMTKEQKINVDFDSENTPESATLEAISQPNVNVTNAPTTLNDAKKLITEMESTIHLGTTTQLATTLTTQFGEDTSTNPATTQPTSQLATKSVLPEAETEARQSTDKLITISQASPSISVTVFEEKQTEAISTTSPTRQSTTPEISGPAFVQQIDASEEQSSSTTKVLNSEKSSTAPITTSKPVQITQTTTPAQPKEVDNNGLKSEPSNRRGLEITRMLRPVQSTKSSQIDFNRDDNEEDESFTDLGSTEKEVVVTKPQKTTVLPTKPAIKAKSVEELSWEESRESRERTRKPHRERTRILSFETEEDGDDFSEERPLRTKRPKARRRKPTIQTTTQSTTQTTTTQQAETTKHWIYEHNQQRTVQEARLKLIDTIINSSSRLIGEAMRNTNNANLPQLAAPGEPFGIESRSQVPLIKSLSPTDALQSKDIENWIRRNPQKVAENEQETTKLVDPKSLPNARTLPNEHNGNERSLGFTPSTDTQLFSFIDKLMKIRPPETDSNLKPPSEPSNSFKAPTNNERFRAPSAKPIARIRTPDQFVQIPERVNERKKIEIQMTTTEETPTEQETRRPRKGKNSDEFYDDYQNHDPTMAPDVPTRTPRIQQQFVTTIENRPQKTGEKMSKLQNSFSVDATPSVLPQNEETILTTNAPTTTIRKTQFSDEATLIQRLEEARRLREKLEKTQLEESVANDGIHFQTNLERRHQIEAKLAKLAEAERWHRTLLERAQLNKQLHGNVDKSKTHTLRDGEVRVAPTAKPVQTTLLSSSTTVQNRQSTIPKHCHPVLKFVEMYNVTEPKSWIHENCQRIKQFYPNTSCEQIEELLSVCFAKQAK